MNNQNSMNDYLKKAVVGADGTIMVSIPGRKLVVQEDWNSAANLAKFQDSTGNLRVRVYVWDSNRTATLEDGTVVPDPGYLVEHSKWVDKKTGEVHEYDHRVSWDIQYDRFSVDEWAILAKHEDDDDHATRQQEFVMIHAETAVINEKTVYQNTITDQKVFCIAKDVTARAVGRRIENGKAVFIRRENSVSETFDFDAFMAQA